MVAFILKDFKKLNKLKAQKLKLGLLEAVNYCLI